MKGSKKERLKRDGWIISDTKSFLELSDEEAAYIELKIKLAQALSKQRKKLNITQIELAKRLHSSQSRVAKMEAGDSSVSLDLLIRSLFNIGYSQDELARLFSRKQKKRAA